MKNSIKYTKIMGVILTLFSIGVVGVGATTNLSAVTEGVAQTVVSQSDSNEMGSKNAYEGIEDSNILEIESRGEVFLGEDPYYLYNNNPVVALVSIDSIDGGRCYSPVFDQYIYAHTYGKMTIVEVYKGDVKNGQQLNYARLGGIVPFDEYYNSMIKEQREKYDYVTKGQRPKEDYVKMQFAGNIDIEVGKVYVAFIQPQTSQDGKYTQYSIMSLQYGLREARLPEAGTRSVEEITVLNNNSGKLESLRSLIPLSK